MRFAALLVACGCTAAHAQVDASSTLSSIRFETFDLRPDDGVTGGYRMKQDEPTMGTWYQSAVVGWQRADEGHEFFEEHADSFDAATNVTAPYDPSYSGRAMHEPVSGYSAHATLSRRGEVSATADSALEAFLHVPHTESRWAGLRVDPYTSLTISFDAAVAVQDLGWMDGVMTRAGAYASATWIASLDGAVPQSALLQVSTSLDGRAESFEQSQRLQLTITNNGADYLVGSLYMGVGAAVAAIPEPSTYALFAAGLWALGWTARRRHAPLAGAIKRAT